MTGEVTSEQGMPEPTRHAGRFDEVEDSVHADLSPLEEKLRQLALQAPEGTLSEDNNK